MGGMIAHATLDLQHGRDALQGPPFVGKAISPRPLQQQLPQSLELRWGQCRPAPRHRFGSQRRLAALLPSCPPR